MNSKNIIGISLFVVVVIIVSAAALVFSRKPSGKQGDASVRSGVEKRQVPGEASQVIPGEENYTVQSKAEAKKALEDLDALVGSAGDASL